MARALAGWEAEGLLGCAPDQPKLFPDWRGSTQKASIWPVLWSHEETHRLAWTRWREASSDFDLPCSVESLGDFSLKSGVQLRPFPFETSPEVVPAPLWNMFSSHVC